MESEYMNIFDHCFERLTDDDKTVLKEYFAGYDYRGSSYTLLANYIWRNTYCLCWEVIDGYLFLAGADCMIGDPNAVTCMPMTRDGKYDTKVLRGAMLKAKARFDERKIPFKMETIPGHMVHILEEAFPGEMEFTHERNDDEYVYEKDKLITLSGRALHKKKNHLNYFQKTYDFEVKPIEEGMFGEIMDLVHHVREAREYGQDEAETLMMEEDAIQEVLNFWDRPTVYGTAILIDGKVEAFALGERLSSDTAVEHFEKANDEYRGLYQAICSEFCKALPEEIKFVNREEDMGLENLRQAKEALKPDHMDEKYSGCFLYTSDI